MPEFALKKGLDLPILGAPEQKIHDGPSVGSVAILGADYLGLKPKMLVAEGDAVTRGTPLFCHKDSPEVVFVAPVSGTVKAINRGARRVLQSVVIETGDADDKGVAFGTIAENATADDIAAKLLASGLWTAFRTRPYSKVPNADTRPAAIYINAMDTEPLAADPEIIIAERLDDWEAGVTAVAKLTEGTCYLCHAHGETVHSEGIPHVQQATFSGPHPAGLSGTHMHFLEPPSATKTVWTISYQDVLAIGALARTGHLDPRVVISIAGPRAINPRLVRTVLGAAMSDLTAHEIEGDNAPARIISGSVLSGRQADGPLAYLGRYARQVTLIKEDHEQIPLGWIRPMGSKFAVQPVLGSAFAKKLYNLTSNLNGGRRAMVPTGTFEELMPQDFLPTQLLRALLVMDTDTAQALGALELDEEDLALCAFACPAKYEYGMALRDSLSKIEKEG